MVRYFLNLLLLVHLVSSAFGARCPPDFCPSHARCVIDTGGHPSCLCPEGFAGRSCEIVLCDEYSCFGPGSSCENTLVGPRCHCETGRTGDNCQLLVGETSEWARCRNATFCEQAFQNGRCDEVCNTHECLYDGRDCQEADHALPHQDQDTVAYSLVMVRVDLSPAAFFHTLPHLLRTLSAFINRTVIVANFDGYDRIFIVTKDGKRATIKQQESAQLDSSFVEVDLAIDFGSSLYQHNDESEQAINQLQNVIQSAIQNNMLSSLHISASSILRPKPATFSATGPLIFMISAIFLTFAIMYIVAIRRAPKRRREQIEAPIWTPPIDPECIGNPPTAQRPAKLPRLDCNEIAVNDPLAVKYKDQSSAVVIHHQHNGSRTRLHQLSVSDDYRSSSETNSYAQYLLDQGEDVNSQDKDGNTALHLAIKYCHLSLTRLLLTCPQTDITLINKSEQTILHTAASTGDFVVIDYILSHPQSKKLLDLTDWNNRTALVVAILNASASDTRFVRKLLAAGADPNYAGDKTFHDDQHNDRMPLHYASQYGLLDHITLLVEHGALVNAADEYRRSPLHYAIDNSKLDAIKLLISLGANRYMHDHADETPVDRANRIHYQEAIDYFNSDDVLKSEPNDKKKRKRPTTEKKRRSNSADTGYQSGSNPEEEVAIPTSSKLGATPFQHTPCFYTSEEYKYVNHPAFPTCEPAQAFPYRPTVHHAHKNQHPFHSLV